MAEIRTETVAVLGGLLNIRVDVAGTGEPLVFFTFCRWFAMGPVSRRAG